MLAMSFYLRWSWSLNFKLLISTSEAGTKLYIYNLPSSAAKLKFPVIIIKSRSRSFLQVELRADTQSGHGREVGR